jgi:hypothetical protein
MQIQILDEHHEAYVSIEAAVRSNEYRRPIALIHVDSHEDLEIPLGNMSCYEAPARLYVEQHLTVGDFLLPLLLKGCLKKIIYVNHRDEACVRANVGSLDGGGIFIRKNIAPNFLKFYPDHKTWLYQETSDIRNLSALVRGYDAILDIDCDYFALNRVPRPIYPFKLSAAQRKQLDAHGISDDSYRMELRLLPHQLPTINRLTFNDSKAWVELFVDYFCRYLDLNPGFALIARSVKSGFTPKKLIRVIESRLTEGLNHSPSRLNIPFEERLELSPFVTKRGKQWYSYSTCQRMMTDPLERVIVHGIVKGQTIGAMKHRFLGLCQKDERLAEYLLLRTVFNMKKKFLIR